MALGQGLHHRAEGGDDGEGDPPLGVDPPGEGEDEREAQAQTEAELQEAIDEAEQGHPPCIVGGPDGEERASDRPHGDHGPREDLADGETGDAHEDRDGLASHELGTDEEEVWDHGLDHSMTRPAPTALLCPRPRTA